MSSKPHNSNKPTQEQPEPTHIASQFPDALQFSSSSSGIQISEYTLPLSQPNRARDPNTKTLLDIIEEKRPKHTPSSSSSTSRQSITLNHEGNNDEAEAGEYEQLEIFTSPSAQAFFWGVPMTFLLYGLDVVVHQQYRQELDRGMIFWRCVKNFPVILGLLYIFHPRRHLLGIQLLFFLLSIMAGCWLVHSVNTAGYYKVMKKAPPVGTLWVWAACEMELGWLAMSCLTVGAFTWWGGYSIV